MTNKNKALGSALENRVVIRASEKGVPAYRQPGSGIYKDHPSDDVIDYTILTECKVRTAQIDAKGNQYIRVDTEWKNKVERQAHDNEFETGIVVVNAKGSRQPFVIVDLDFFLDLVKHRKDSQ